MSHGELLASPGITGPSTGIRKRNLKIITDTLPSFTDQQSSESARENISRLDPFADPTYLYDGAGVISGSTTPYIFTPARVLISNDMRFRFYPPDQTVVSSRSSNHIGQDALIEMHNAGTKSIPFISEEPPEAVLMPETCPDDVITPSLDAVHPKTLNVKESLVSASISIPKKSDRRGRVPNHEHYQDTTTQIQPTECKKSTIPSENNLCHADLKRMVQTLSKTERNTLMQLLSQEIDSENDVTNNIHQSNSGVDMQINNLMSAQCVIGNIPVHNTSHIHDYMESSINIDSGGSVPQCAESQQQQNYIQSKHDSSSNSEPVRLTTSPPFHHLQSSNARRPNMHTTGGNYGVHDSPIIVNTDSSYAIPNVPKIYINESAMHYVPHSNAQCKFTGLGFASSTFDRRRPRPTFRATIYDDSPKAPKAFTEHDDNIILASITYYVGDYGTTDLNWHIIYYYYSLLVYNNRTLSSLRSRFHKYLKIDFKFDLKDYTLSYWLDTLELCASVMHHTNVPITKRGELCNLIASKGNKVHYLLTCIFIFLRPDMQYNELKHNFCIWLELITGPHSFS